MTTQAYEREQLHKVTFTSTPKIRRKKQRNRSVRNTCEALVASFFPMINVPYNVMKTRLMTKFDRCDRKTVLSYLGRPVTRQVERVEHTVRYLKSGEETQKQHVFLHKLPAKRGYLEIFELAELHSNKMSGESWFRLNHTVQTELFPPKPPQPESLKESVTSKTVGSPKTFSAPLNSGCGERDKKFLKPKLLVKRTEIERESLRGRENRSSESNI